MLEAIRQDAQGEGDHIGRSFPLGRDVTDRARNRLESRRSTVRPPRVQTRSKLKLERAGGDIRRAQVNPNSFGRRKFNTKGDFSARAWPWQKRLFLNLRTAPGSLAIFRHRSPSLLWMLPIPGFMSFNPELTREILIDVESIPAGEPLTQ